MCKHIKRKKDNRAGGSRAASHFVQIMLRGLGAGDRGRVSEDGNKRETYDPVQPGRVTVRCVSSVAGILLIIMRLI